MKIYEWAREHGLTNEAVAIALMNLKHLPNRPPVIMPLAVEDRALLETEFASRGQPARAAAPESESRYAVSAPGFDALEFTALDESDAVGQYVRAKRLDAHQHRFQVTPVQH